MSNSAYEVTEEGVANVLRSNWAAVANTNGKPFESIANEVFFSLDLDLIEQAALLGDNMNEQTNYANNEITRQLREMGILEPLREASNGTNPLMDTQQEIALINLGYKIEPRDPDVNPGHSGKFMITDPDDDEDGYAIVGDDRAALINEAYNHLANQSESWKPIDSQRS